jgi:hypothetical protein
MAMNMRKEFTAEEIQIALKQMKICVHSVTKGEIQIKCLSKVLLFTSQIVNGQLDITTSSNI